jgi:hypothetical protein
MISSKEMHLRRKEMIAQKLAGLLAADSDLERRSLAARSLSSRVRTTEYHLRNSRNIRCRECWFFEFGHDQAAREAEDIGEWRRFVLQQKKSRRINCALLIGGEPTLFADRIEAFVEQMRFVSISTNGLKAFQNIHPFDNVTVFVTLFGGGPLDDELRAIKPGGMRFTGLFERALEYYRDDRRATFVYAVTESGMTHIEPTVRRIRDNGNHVTFNFYSQYNTGHPLRLQNQQRLLSEMLRVRDACPGTVLNHPAHIAAIVTGQAWCGGFDYTTCPSVSQDHPDNASRNMNGNPTLTFCNTYKADLQTLELCCTSGHCADCRYSQAIFSWLIVSLSKSLDDIDALRTWVSVAESYWSQFIWSPFHPTHRDVPRAAPDRIEDDRFESIQA